MAEKLVVFRVGGRGIRGCWVGRAGGAGVGEGPTVGTVPGGGEVVGVRRMALFVLRHCRVQTKP